MRISAYKYSAWLLFILFFSHSALSATPIWQIGTPTTSLKNGAIDAGQYGVYFDGNDDYLDDGQLNLTGTSMSMAAWIYSSDLSNCDLSECLIMQKSSSSVFSDVDFSLSTVLVGTKWYLKARLKIDSVLYELTALYGSLNPDAWIHAAAIYDGSVLKLYHNGNQVASLWQSGSVSTSASPSSLILGGNQLSTEQKGFIGYINSAEVYDENISLTELAALAALIPNIPVQTPPVASYVDLEIGIASNFTLDIDSEGMLTIGQDKDSQIFLIEVMK